MILIFCLFILQVFSANEKIINLNQDKKFGARLFYPVDDSRQKNYGCYVFNTFSGSVEDLTLEPYQGKLDLKLIKRYGISYSIFRKSIPWACISLTAGGFFFGGFTWVIVDSFYNPAQYETSSYPDSYLNNLRTGCTVGVVLGGLLILCGFSFVALFSYGVADCNRLKKQILGILNNESISLIENKNIKINFAFYIKAIS
jgi:hypothetical protein